MTFRMAMQLVHLVIPFLIILRFPKFEKAGFNANYAKVGTCIAITYYMYIMYAVYYSSVSRNKGERCACEIIHSVLKSLGT